MAQTQSKRVVRPQAADLNIIRHAHPYVGMMLVDDRIMCVGQLVLVHSYNQHVFFVEFERGRWYGTAKTNVCILGKL